LSTLLLIAVLILSQFSPVGSLRFCGKKALIFLDLYDILLGKRFSRLTEAHCRCKALGFKRTTKMSLKSTSRLRRILLKGILIVLLACVVVIILLSLSIELGVKKICGTATQKYPGDKVEALIMFVESKEYGYNAHRYSANNHAFWALGQLGDLCLDIISKCENILTQRRIL